MKGHQGGLLLVALLPKYLEARTLAGISAKEVEAEEKRLWELLAWCAGKEIMEASQVTLASLEGYMGKVMELVSRKGELLDITTRRKRLTAAKSFFRWMKREGYVEVDPAEELELPRVPRRLPRAVLSEAEVERLMAQPDLSTPEGLRDRVMLEVLYSTGMRRNELLDLGRFDAELGQRTVRIRQGKGRKDRVVPLGERAAYWVERYLKEAEGRPVKLEGDTREAAPLFPLDKPYRHALSIMVRRYLDRAGIEKAGACHLLRHTAATLMLQNGADIRSIQELLGHARLSTTQIYTRVTIVELKEAHRRTHPAAKIRCT